MSSFYFTPAPAQCALFIVLRLLGQVLHLLRCNHNLTKNFGSSRCLQLGTAFEYGPTWRVKYNPNDGNPPALEIKVPEFIHIPALFVLHTDDESEIRIWRR
jgi:hypothetical protein